MNSIAHRLQAIASVPPSPVVTGHWFNIRLCPDLAFGELLNVGVGYIDSATQRIYTRLIDRLDRFRSLYGEGFEDEVRVMLRIVERNIEDNYAEPPLPNIRFSEVKFAAGESVQDILDKLYDATIPVSLDVIHADSQAREASAGNEAVRKLVFAELKRIAGLAAEQIVSPHPVYTVRENDRVHALDIPLRGQRHLGSVVSARYKTTQTVETNLLRASVDLETAARVFNQDRLGLFVMRPSADTLSSPSERIMQIDNLIDTIGWKLHKQGVHVEVEEEPAQLAVEIIEWAGLES